MLAIDRIINEPRNLAPRGSPGTLHLGGGQDILATEYSTVVAYGLGSVRRPWCGDAR
jgi:hypothetical protein